jgi:hypothetical protein
LTNVFPGNPLTSVELGRFVLLDEVEGNGESWFLARCFSLLPRKVRGVVSFSDPFPREDSKGRLVFPGHIGTIYQASSAVYLGTGPRRSLHLLPDARVFSNRAIQKIRKRERGWQYAAAILEAFQPKRRRKPIDPLGEERDARAWLEKWLPRLTRVVRHPGHHKYAFPLWRPARRLLPPSLPYPKNKETA